MPLRKQKLFADTLVVRTVVFAFITIVCAGFMIIPSANLGQNKLYSYQKSQPPLPNWAFGGFVRPPGVNPVISPNDKTIFNCPMKKMPVAWESNDTFNPAAVLKDGKIIVLYRAEDKSGVAIGERTSRLGYASSADGFSFQRRPQPVLYPGDDSQKEFEHPGGCEDPRVAVTEDGTYVVIYTQWNRKVPRLGLATSKDLITWTKHGPIFRKAFNGKFFDMASKSASIVTSVKGGKQVITKVNGKYFLYWGEHHVYGAASDDLINWQPVVDASQNLKEFISPRTGFFDSDLTECGPPAVMTDKGILLLYNGKNAAGDRRDKRFTPNSYCAGQVLFDKKDPAKAIARLDVPFLRPMEPFEKSGQYVAGTVFVEGLVYFQKKWFMYYGCADSRVGVAIYDPAHPALPDPLPQ
ncbi:MAG: glycoside hydrolase family 130 protein [Chitinophagaceae bacterium]